MIGLLRRALRPFAPSLDDILREQGGNWFDGATFVLSFDVETRADCEALPAVLELLRERSLRASFACIGALVERYPAAHRAVHEAGHELFNHTDTHPWHDELGVLGRFDRLEDDGLEREIRGGQAKLAAIGAHSIGFRAPHFGAQRTPRMYPVLRAVGIAYSSSTTATRGPRGGAPHRVGGVVEIPVLVCPQHPRAALDSWHCTTAPDAAHREPRGLLALYRAALAALGRWQAFGSVYWDPRVALDPGYVSVLDLLAKESMATRTYAELVLVTARVS